MDSCIYLFLKDPRQLAALEILSLDNHSEVDVVMGTYYKNCLTDDSADLLAKVLPVKMPSLEMLILTSSKMTDAGKDKLSARLGTKVQLEDSKLHAPS